MSDDWDVYFCTIEDQPASVRVNLGLASEAPYPHLDVCAYVRVTINAPDANGFVTADEFPALTALEDVLVGELTSDEDTLFVGCCTAFGLRDFIFFTDDEEGWDKRVASALASFPQYQAETGANKDATWSGYFEFLYPNPYDMDVIQNRRVCKMLKEQGDDLAKKRIIDHSMTFFSKETAVLAARTVETQGFAIKEIIEVHDEEDSPEFHLLIQRADAPEKINNVTAALLTIAEETGGDYTGWGTTPVD